MRLFKCDVVLRCFLAKAYSVNVEDAFEGPTTVKFIRLPDNIIGPAPLLTDTLSMYKGSKGAMFTSGIPKMFKGSLKRDDL